MSPVATKTCLARSPMSMVFQREENINFPHNCLARRDSWAVSDEVMLRLAFFD